MTDGPRRMYTLRDEQVANQRTYWNAVWTEHTGRREDIAAAGHWLHRLLAAADCAPPARLLEVGCGRGADTRYLLERGFALTSVDLSRVALRSVAAFSPHLDVAEVALPAPLPFGPAVFDCVVAGLSLHYFRWADTQAIIADIRRELRPGGVLCFRVNAAGDVGSGFGQGEEIESNLFLRNGRTKRFFTEDDCRALFATGWTLEELQSEIDPLFSSPKYTWFGWARRSIS